MITVSNSDFACLLECLSETIDTYQETGDLKAYNKYRRRKLMLSRLKKKMQL